MTADERLPTREELAEQSRNEIERLERERDHWLGEAQRYLRHGQEAVDENEQLRAALDSFVRIAGEAATEWDNDNDARVGKMLLAMAGYVPGYRADIDAIHALRRGAS